MENNNLSQRIRTLREVLGLSQNEFASKINRTSNFIAQIESGRSNISEKTKTAICTTYHINPEWMNNGTGEIFKPGFAPPPFDKAGIPTRIKTVRQKLNMTQDEFAKMIDCSKSQLTSVEVGRVNPSNQWIAKLARLANVNLSWLLSGKGEIFTIENSNEDNIDVIFQFLSDNPRFRHIVSEAISAYTIQQDDTIWKRMEETLKSDTD
ncbi:MAG: helix-turn-helix domain-containing protein [Acidaminococcaceae bacterium]|nr:helix-turn-helix domain-containing protein [Acidaminococcaceae bacterium]